MSVDVSSGGPSTAPGVALPGGGWLFGRATDLLIGAGFGYLLSLPLLMWMTHTFGLSSWPTAVFLLSSLGLAGPHYGATILRVYEFREDRRRYAVFALWTTVVVCLLFVVGLRQAFVGSLFVTLYATWSPWHFSGQNYGVAMMFLRRRGVPVDETARRFFYASFVLAFALSFLVMHGQTSILSYSAVPIGALSSYDFISLGISRDVLSILVPATAFAYLLSLVGALVLLLRKARLRDLGPAACLVLVTSLWFAVPAVATRITGQPFGGLAFTIVWLSATHSLQYLWVCYYYARGTDTSLRFGSYFMRTLMAGSVVTILPAIIFAPGLLGSVPWDNGLAILLISAVNIHHFILDGAIWKLRDGKVAQFLLREVPPAREESAGGETRGGWFRPSMAVLGVISLSVAVLDGWEREVNVNRGGGDIVRAIGAANRLAWIGRDSPQLHTQIALNLAAQNQFALAIDHYEQSLALFPTAAAWVGLGQLYAGREHWQAASDAFAAATEFSPDNPGLLAQSGQAYMHLGRPDLARAALERALELAPRNEQLRRDLARAIAAESAGS